MKIGQFDSSQKRGAIRSSAKELDRLTTRSAKGYDAHLCLGHRRRNGCALYGNARPLVSGIPGSSAHTRDSICRMGTNGRGRLICGTFTGANRRKALMVRLTPIAMGSWSRRRRRSGALLEIIVMGMQVAVAGDLDHLCALIIGSASMPAIMRTSRRGVPLARLPPFSVPVLLSRFDAVTITSTKLAFFTLWRRSTSLPVTIPNLSLLLL